MSDAPVPFIQLDGAWIQLHEIQAVVEDRPLLRVFLRGRTEPLVLEASEADFVELLELLRRATEVSQ